MGQEAFSRYCYCFLIMVLCPMGWGHTLKAIRTLVVSPMWHLLWDSGRDSFAPLLHSANCWVDLPGRVPLLGKKKKRNPLHIEQKKKKTQNLIASTSTAKAFNVANMGLQSGFRALGRKIQKGWVWLLEPGLFLDCLIVPLCQVECICLFPLWQRQVESNDYKQLLMLQEKVSAIITFEFIHNYLSGNYWSQFLPKGTIGNGSFFPFLRQWGFFHFICTHLDLREIRHLTSIPEIFFFILFFPYPTKLQYSLYQMNSSVLVRWKEKSKICTF